ncbi:MAG: hypothetical protein JHC81_06425 [Brevundimonas sp.]|uniref:hypothetical protein n=1 Tax=Brevundimonas sp. TaxID=1871086 RepID=UPI001A28F9BE|nr:hypothetical protein [Brevundimonas sp.]MBJ7447154.1 hypothetical protein [Brevundimonas sp.]
MSDSTFFSTDYLDEAIKETTAYRSVDVAGLRVRLDEIAVAFPQNARTNESQTEDDFIWPVLTALGWTDSLRQQNLTVTGRDDVPDGLLFAEAQATANAQDDMWRRDAHGLEVVESKRWDRPLYRASGRDESRDDIRYIYSTFPIVEREGIAKWGAYRRRDLALAWLNTRMAGQPDAEIAG